MFLDFSSYHVSFLEKIYTTPVHFFGNNWSVCVFANISKAFPPIRLKFGSVIWSSGASRRVSNNWRQKKLPFPSMLNIYVHNMYLFENLVLQSIDSNEH